MTQPLPCNIKILQLNVYRPIGVVIPHTGDTVKITFGSTLKGNACHQSFGVDDVMIYTK